MTNDIKKSLLITLDFPPNLGGVAGYYYNIAKNFPGGKIVVLAPDQQAGNNFDLIQNFPIIRKKMNFLPQPGSANVPVLSQLKRSVKWLSAIRYISQIAKPHKIEMLQIGQILPLGTLAMIYRQKTKIPYIFYSHGLDIVLPQRIKRKKSLLKKIIKNAHGIVANSYFTKDELIGLGADEEKIVVAYPCPHYRGEHVNPAEIQIFKDKHDLNDKKILLSVGRLVERKGFDMAIKALPAVIKQVPNVKYLIAGRGYYRAELEKIVSRLKLGHHVEFFSDLTDEEIKILYEICDIFTMPSRQLKNGDVEGFGIVYLEANSFGKPAIGGRSGGVPEAILDGRTGILVDPADINDIAQKTVRLLADEQYAHLLGLQGQERVEEEFNWDDQVEKILPLLK